MNPSWIYSVKAANVEPPYLILFKSPFTILEERFILSLLPMLGLQ
ncbi:hypothetical protein M565_ctg1P0228 [Vibrio cyclitrophicus FF75]|nr:hypothetical protein M565_ctg1P0228 [Vibrio cyclitrophicus FF75]